MSSQAGNNLIRTTRLARFHHTNDCIYLFGCSAVAAVYLETDFTSSTRGLSALVTVFPNKTDSIQRVTSRYRLWHQCPLVVWVWPSQAQWIHHMGKFWRAHFICTYLHRVSCYRTTFWFLHHPKESSLDEKMTSQKHLFILTTFRMQSLLLFFCRYLFTIDADSNLSRFNKSTETIVCIRNVLCR